MNKKLRIHHYPQLPCKPFIVDVKDEKEAFLIGQTLSNQHLWLNNNNFIPDYSNAITVVQWNKENQEWEDYYNEELGMDWDEYCGHIEFEND
jgi:hypothetical protein